MQLFQYDDGDERSIERYAKKLENKTFKDVLEMYQKSPIKKYHNPNNLNFTIEEETTDYVCSTSAKGQLGNFLEKYYFGYKPNSKQEPDFPKVGIELKQTCVDKKKNGKFTAGERLSITNISYNDPIEPDFYKSHVWDKIKRILLVHYLRDKTKDRLDYKFLFVNLFTPPKEDLSVIIQDYNKINNKIKLGLAHELSESDTMYLGACTKGVNAEKSMRPQYYGNHTLARKRNFCFKRQYMDYVLNAYVLKNQVPYESIIKNKSDLENTTFEEYVLNKINQYIGKTDQELCHQFDREYNNNKAQWSELAYRMLGIRSNQAEEFVKAGIVVKAIRIEENGTIRESISFPAFKFKELVKEEWEESKLFNYFNETKFLFVIYKKSGESYVLKGAKLWNMPYDDLNVIVCDGWKKVKDKINNGITFTKKGNVIQNDLLSKKDNIIIHIRPHAQKAAYKLHNGYERGNIERDANELPDGQWMTTQCFWINNTYILSQLGLDE